MAIFGLDLAKRRLVSPAARLLRSPAITNRRAVIDRAFSRFSLRLSHRNEPAYEESVKLWGPLLNQWSVHESRNLPQKHSRTHSSNLGVFAAGRRKRYQFPAKTGVFRLESRLCAGVGRSKYRSRQGEIVADLSGHRNHQLFLSYSEECGSIGARGTVQRSRERSDR